MNKVILCGRLTNEPTISMAKDLEIARFNLAVDRKTKDKGADFPSCIAFGKVAENIERYAHKGTKIIITGHIQTGSYDKDGKKVYTTDVAVEEFEFAESKNSNSNSQAAEVENKGIINDGFMDVNGIDEELPFA